MASMYKRGDVWWIQYRIGGKNVQRSLDTESEQLAKLKLKQMEGLHASGQLGLPSRTPIQPFLEVFCEHLQQRRSKTSYRADISYLRTFFGPLCDALKTKAEREAEKENPSQADEVPSIPASSVPVRYLEDVTPGLVNHFISGRIETDGISPKTANRTRELLHVMFNYAIKHHGFVSPIRGTRNPIENVDRRPEPAPNIRFLKLDEITKQLNVLKKRPVLRTAAAIMIYAGLRREECLWLTQEDVDFDQRIIRVRAKTQGEESWQPKTKRNRAVPISNALYAVLKEYRSKKNCTWFVPSPEGKRWHPDNFSHALAGANSHAELPWGSLDFRHTFGSQLAMKGESLYKISELMGNSPEICRRHYAALVPEKMRDTVEFDVPVVAKAVKSPTRQARGQRVREGHGRHTLALVRVG